MPQYDPEEIKRAQELVLANVSPRYLELDGLERWGDGRQYEGLADWFTDGKDAPPLMERAPCVRYLVAKAAAESNVDLILGEGRFPAITSSPGEDDSVFDEDLGLDKASSKIVDRFIQILLKQCRFKPAAREVLREAQLARSCALVFCVRDGRLACNTLKAKWCTPAFVSDPNSPVASLVIQYPYIEHYRDNAGKWRTRTRIYRREIDATNDVTMLPGEATPDGIEPKWKPDPAQTFKHGFGFCPVIWYAHLKSCSTVADYDGRAIHEGHLSEIRAIDVALSMRHRAAIRCSDPQWTECGVEPGYCPTEEGRTADVPATASGGTAGTGNMPTGKWRSNGGTRKARKKGPGIVWQYESADVKVEQHTLPADALKAITDHAQDLRSKLGELLCHVFLDPESVKFASALSGKAMDAFRERQLSRCDQVRDDMGDKFIVPAVLMALRIVGRLLDAGQAIKIKGLKKTAPILKRFTRDDPDLTLVWGGYSKPDPEDEQKTVSAVKAAYEAGVITRRMALEKLKSANVFHIENIDAALAELDGEAARASKREEGLVGAMARLAEREDEDEDDADGATGDEGGAGGNVAGRTSAPPRAGSGNAGAATGREPPPPA